MIFTINIVDIALSIAIALIVARIIGYFFDRFKQPVVIGEILAGVLIGNLTLGAISGISFSVLGFIIELPQLSYTSEEFLLFADLGILLLMFITGLETSLSKLRRLGKPTFLVAVGGVIVPLILGAIGTLLLGYSFEVSLIIGLVLVATSVGVTVRTLIDLHVLNTNVGITILGAAVVDDVLGILVFALMLGVINPLQIGITIVLFFIIFFYLGLRFIERIMDLGDKITIPKSLLSIALAIFLIYVFFADRAGITGITGAFVAGLLIGQTGKIKKISDDVKAVSYGFFIPLFFVSIGASVNPAAFLEIGLLSLVVITIGVFGKIFGCGIGAYFSGMTLRQSLQVGIGMIPRMEVALIIASMAISRGFLQGPLADQVLATTILLTIVTTFITPFLLKIACKYPK